MIARMTVEPGMFSARARTAEPTHPMMAVVCPAAKYAASAHRPAASRLRRVETVVNIGTADRICRITGG
jgi:hypothetical protein